MTEPRKRKQRNERRQNGEPYPSRPVRASAADPPDRSPRTVSIRSGGGRAFCGGDPEEAGTSGSLAGRGGNDEGAKQDAL
ncbi:MAG: hypothetical protein IKZ55_03300 [Bacteroidales bacterium]|nr:hypothetical protein [Bacteroidales bacterium]